MVNSPHTISALNQQKLAFEERKIRVQEKGLEQQEKRFEQQEKFERKKLVVEWARAAGIVVPLIVVTVTVIFGLIREHQKEDADFQVKAAEIVMNSQTPAEAKAKAEALKIFFDQHFKRDFAATFVAEKFTNSRYDPDYEAKLELLRMVLQNPRQKQEIVERWVKVFPNYAEWANALK
jgi:hypothetical protein